MSGDGTTFTIDLPVTGKPAIDAASSAVDVLAARLDSASKASEAASSAVKAGEASYRQAERSADAAAKALERIGIAAKAQQGKLQVATEAGDTKGVARAEATLKQLAKRQEEVTEKATAAKAAVQAQAVALDKLKTSATAAEKAEEKAKKQLEEFKKAQEGGDEEGLKVEGLERGLHKLGGPLGEAGAEATRFLAGWEKISKSVGNAGPWVAGAVGIVAILGAVVALTAALAAGIEKVIEFSLKLADTRDQSLLLAQGIARSLDAGERLDNKMYDLARTLPFTREELQEMAKKLGDAGLRGKQLSDQLEITATKAAKLKFGPDFAKEMLSLDQQSKIFKANISDIFGGLHTEKLLEAIQKLIGLFDVSTASGKAMKVVFESLFQPLVDNVAGAEPKVERFFLQMEIWALKALIAIKPYGSTILKVGEALLIAAAIVAGVFVVAFLLLAAAIAAPFILLAGIVYSIMQVIDAGKQLGASIKGWFKGVDFGAIGSAIIDGLINGITGGGLAVFNALKGVVMGAVDGIKGLLGIHSPSKLFESEIGLQIAAGTAAGVDRGGPMVQDSLEAITSPSTAQGKGPQPPGQAPSTGKGVSLNGVTFNINGVQGADDAVEKIKEVLTRILEGDVAQLGAAQPVTT